MANLAERIEKMLAEVPGEYRVFKMNQNTFNENFGPKNREKYPLELVEIGKKIPVDIDNTMPNGEFYLLSFEPVEDEVFECPDCGDEVSTPGQCVFCFATASIGG